MERILRRLDEIEDERQRLGITRSRGAAPGMVAPFRDSAHIRHDSGQLGLPAFLIGELDSERKVVEL